MYAPPFLSLYLSTHRHPTDDPEFPTYKASYRDFLRASATYQRTFEFKDDTVQRKIAQTYRLQYLKDVVLARVIDDSTFNVLNSFILFNQIDIINYIIGENPFLGELFRGFITSGTGAAFGNGNGNGNGNGMVNGKERANAPSPPANGSTSLPTTSLFGSSTAPSTTSILPFPASTSASSSTEDSPIPVPLSTKSNGHTAPSTKPDIIRFVHQLCLMGKNVQIPTRLALYRALVERGLLFALEWALRRPVPSVGAATTITNGSLDKKEEKGKAPEPSASTSTSTAATSASVQIQNQAQAQALALDVDPPLLDMVAEIFILVAEFNIAGVRAHIVRQAEAAKEREAQEALARGASPVPASGKPASFAGGAGGSGRGEDPHLLKALIARLGGTREQPFRNQIGDAIRLLLESPPNMDFHSAGDVSLCLLSLLMSR